MKVFLCHSSSDKEMVRHFYEKLKQSGFDPWLDEIDILPGEEWSQVIPKAVKKSHAVIVFLSNEATAKEGYVQKEIQMALDAADEKPDGTIFIIPACLEDCAVPERLQRWQWVHLNKSGGYEKLIAALKRRQERVSDENVLKTQNVSLRKIDFKNEDLIDEWMIYEVAFLWNDFSPPSIQDHWNLMTPEVKRVKEALHNAIDRGVLKISREERLPTGYTRYVERTSLIDFSNSKGVKPKFLFPEERV